MKTISVRNMLTSKVISVSSGTTLSRAISLMEKNKISCLLIADNKKPVGILTERDLVVAVHQRSSLDRLKVKDLMTGQVITANINIDIFEALAVLEAHNIRHLVITYANGNLAGLLTQSDIRNNLGFEYFVEIKQISKIMTKNIVTATRGSLVGDVISKMAEYAISCIVVEDKGHPVGMLTERDIVSLLKKEADMETLGIEDVMNSPVKTVPLDTPIHEASKIMNQNNIRRLVVLDKKGKSTGLITQSDIIKRFERRYIEILKDIILEKEAALQETRKQLSDKIVLDNIMRSSMDMAIVASDLNCNIIYFNPFAEKIYRLKSEKAIGKTIMDLFKKSTTDKLRIQSAIEKVKKGKDFRYVSNRVEKGKARFIESVVSGIRDRKGRLAGFAIMSRDMTKRKLADEALQSSEKKYRNFVDNALVGIFQTNVTGDVLFVNEALLRILEFKTQDEAIAGGIIGRFTKSERIATFMQVLVDKGKVDNFETEIRTKTAKTINLLLSATIEENVISGVIIDITRVKNLEEQLHQSQKMEALGTLTGGIAHEFNNILMIITTWGTLLQMEIENDNPLREHIDIIVDAARKAAKLTQGLLTYTRIPIHHKEPTDVNELIENIAGYLSNIIRKDIQFKAVTTGNNLTILADRAQIEQVIMNLATNALDAMEEMGSLTIRSKLLDIKTSLESQETPAPPGQYALISVTDTGTGIDRNIQTRVFEPFFTTKAIGKGTGLGLSIVYGIIKKHGGYINVESNPDSGTTFKIYLPVIPTEGTQEHSLHDFLTKEGTGTVLLAEDDEAVMKAITKVLDKAGYHTIQAVNGEEALLKYMEFRDEINLLLFDIVMPRMNGKDAYEEIRRNDPDIKVLFISGYMIADGVESTIVNAGLPFITKPVSPLELERKIKAILC